MIITVVQLAATGAVATSRFVGRNPKKIGVMGVVAVGLYTGVQAVISSSMIHAEKEALLWGSDDDG
jgi:hypothetical protein